jgi:hypothetical protein
MVDANDPFPVTALALDAVGYSTYPISVHLEWRREIRAAMTEACRRARIDEQSVSSQDTGSGILAMIPATVSKARVVADLVRELHIAIFAYNRARNSLGRIRLRLALHAGECVVDGTGFAGEAPIIACRLVDSPPVNSLLKKMPEADLAVIVSDSLFQDTVGHRFRGLKPESFHRVYVHTAKYSGTAWLHVPVPTASAAHRNDRRGDDSEGGNRHDEDISDTAATARREGPEVRNTYHGKIQKDFFNAGSS